MGPPTHVCCHACVFALSVSVVKACNADQNMTKRNMTNKYTKSIIFNSSIRTISSIRSMLRWKNPVDW